ncbi:MAG: fatty acid desaturase [Flavisolibacter sp.]|nr:fatty acid desaturase [Flavisolibacter sp.]
MIFVLITGHFTSICSSLYLHRSMTHRGVIFKPSVSFLMRLWLWLATGMNTRQWVAIHRKHHAFPDKEGDPHSPIVKGFWAIMIYGVKYYREAGRDEAMIEKYGKGCPNDWWERNVFSKYQSLGIFILLGVYLLLFGLVWGPIVWLIQMAWMPFIGQIVNGIGHYFGYRNTDSKDHSRNIIPVGVVIVGEELHNNHHANPASPKFSQKWFEFDLGWVYIRILSFLGLAEINYKALKPHRLKPVKVVAPSEVEV